MLVRYLEQYYGADHETAIYEAPIYAICDPFIQEVPLAKVPEAHVSPISTLYIPPKDAGVPDEEMLEQLGLASSDLYVKKGCWETGHSVAKTDSR